MMPSILGVDLGTSACKACLISTDGERLGEARASYPTYAPEPLWAEQDPADWLRAVITVVREVLAQHPDAHVAGIALTSAAHIGVLLDAQGEPGRRALLWHDQRASQEVAALEETAGAEILRQSYQAVSTSWTLPHLCWVRTHDPQAWARTRTILLSKDYLAAWLVGRAVTDPATALSSQCYDATTGRWSPELCGLAGIEPAMLPEISTPTAVIGGITSVAATALGLPTGTPVVLGSVDSATELFATGACTPPQGMVRLATAGGVQCLVAAPTPHRQRITYPYLLAPLWYCQAGTNTCATAIRWGMRLLTGGDALSFAEWDSLAADTPAGADGLLFHPYLAGERAPYWDAALRGSFTGFSLHHERRHMIRAIYEGVAFSIRDAMSVLPIDLSTTEPLNVTGGGSNSALFVNILASVLRRPLHVIGGADSAYGAAWLGGMSLDLTQQQIPPVTTASTVDPCDDDAAVYLDRFTAYRYVQQQLARYYLQTS